MRRFVHVGLAVATLLLLGACNGGSDSPAPAAAPAAAAPAPSGAVTPASNTVTVKLIALNDFHGNLEPPGGNVVVADAANAAGARVSAGGAAYLATLISTMKASNPNSVVVAAGDMIGASPLTSAAFHDEPTIDALGAMGLEFSSVGNHEFDMGKTELQRLQNGGCFPPSSDGKRGVVGVDTCMNGGRFEGARFKYLAANVMDQASGRTLFPAYLVKSVGGVKIGFIGLTLKDTPTVVTPAGVTGLTFTDEVATVNALVPALKAENVASIVVLIHQGGATTAAVANDKACPGFNGDILSIIDRLDRAIDVVVSGHTHQEYVCSRPDGKLVTQTGFYGRLASEINLTIDTTQNKVTSKVANNRPAINPTVLRDTAGAAIAIPAGYSVLAKDSTIDALVTRYVGLTAPIKNVIEGSITASITRTQTTAGESSMGDLVADAYLAATSDPSFGPATIGFTNPGGLRQDLAYDSTTAGQVNFGMLYNVLPFTNNMTTMTLTGTQIKRLLEQQWELPQPAGGRVLQVSAGFTYLWDSSKPEGAVAGQGDRVVTNSIRLNGVTIAPTANYRVTVNNFMASGGDNFTVLKQGTNVQQGPIDIDIFEAYFRAHTPYTPTPRDRIVRQ